MSFNPQKASANPIIPLENTNINLEESGENLVKAMNGSFFDDPKATTKVFMKNSIALSQLQHNNNVYSKAPMSKKLTKEETYKTYNFFLTENGIYYTKVYFNVFLYIFLYFFKKECKR